MDRLQRRIYNYVTLREQLIARGVKFHSGSDTEVILRIYEAYGAAFLDHIDGMFALAIWDRGAMKCSLRATGSASSHCFILQTNFVSGLRPR